MTADHPPVPREILTERLVLRPYVDADVEALIDAIEESRAQLDPWMAWAPSMRHPDDALRLFQRGRENWAAGTDFGLGIFQRETGRYLGGTGLHAPNWAVPSIEIGYWMRTSETGKGYVREAVIGLTSLGFGTLGMRRMVITCAATNTRSRTVAEATGFVLEGRLRNDDRLPSGDLRDTLVYALIDTDPVARDPLTDGREAG